MRKSTKNTKKTQEKFHQFIMTSRNNFKHLCIIDSLFGQDSKKGLELSIIEIKYISTTILCIIKLLLKVVRWCS